MQRCLQLAEMGRSAVAPNPMVGAVLVYEGRIIGEGYHQRYGGPHAEVVCLQSVSENDRELIPASVLYVSLEPCAHFGKTPPCADLIIREKIGKVVVGCRDPFPQVSGKGIEKLKEAGVEVITDVLAKECRYLNRRFFTFHTEHRPYIILKWAESADGFIGKTGSRTAISSTLTNRLVHKWRSTEMSILVGTNTAAIDNPQLTARLWPGRQPLRLVIDRQLRLSKDLELFSGEANTVVFNRLKHDDGEEKEGLRYYQLADDSSEIQQILTALRQMGVQSVLVEGGGTLLQSFINEGAWDEARVIRNNSLSLGDGVPAPLLTGGIVQEQQILSDDSLFIYHPTEFIFRN